MIYRLFSRAQFSGRSNRTIFNTPNPRLMNVSLVKESELSSRNRNGSCRKSRYENGSLASDTSTRSRNAISGGNLPSVSHRQLRQTSSSLRDSASSARRSISGSDRPNERPMRASNSRARRSSTREDTASNQQPYDTPPRPFRSVKFVKRSQSCRTDHPASSKDWRPNNQRYKQGHHHYLEGGPCSRDLIGNQVALAGGSVGVGHWGRPLGAPSPTQRPISAILEHESDETPCSAQEAVLPVGDERRGRATLISVEAEINMKVDSAAAEDNSGDEAT